MRRSWIDALVEWGTNRRIPWWVLVGAYSAFVGVGMNAVRWLDGTLPTGEFTIHTGDFLYGMIPLVAYGALTRVAHRALDRFRPALGADVDAEAIRRKLTSLPMRVAAIIGIVGLALGVGSFFGSPEVLDKYDDSMLSLVFAIVFSTMLNVALTLTLIVRIGRIIHTVSRAHRDAGRIDLLHPEPAHAFASLTAVAGASVLAQLTYSIATDPATFENPVWITFSISVGLTSVVAFFLPLIEMRRRLDAERDRLVEHTSRLIDDVTSAVERALHDEELDRIGPLKTSRDVFESQLERIEDASTWPWDPGTLRGFASSLLLPLFLWFVTNVLGNWFGI